MALNPVLDVDKLISLERAFGIASAEGDSLYACWRPESNPAEISSPATARYHPWYIIGGAGRQLDKFEELAAEASLIMGNPEKSVGVVFWLDYIRNKGIFFTGSSYAIEPSETEEPGGFIWNLWTASVKVCQQEIERTLRQSFPKTDAGRRSQLMTDTAWHALQNSRADIAAEHQRGMLQAKSAEDFARVFERFGRRRIESYGASALQIVSEEWQLIEIFFVYAGPFVNVSNTWDLNSGFLAL